MGFITEEEALGITSAEPKKPGAPGVGFITEEEATGFKPPPTFLEKVKGLYTDFTSPRLTEGNSSIYERGQTMKPPTFDEVYGVKARALKTKLDAQGEVAPAPRPSPLESITNAAAGTLPQLSDMLTSTGKSLVGIVPYTGAYAYKRAQGVQPKQAAKEAAAFKEEVLPAAVFAPWGTIAAKLGGEAEQAYKENPVAWVMGAVAETVNSGVEGAAAKTGIPAEHFAALTDEFMGLAGAIGFKPQLVKTINTRLTQFSGVGEAKGMGGFGPAVAELMKTAPALTPAHATLLEPAKIEVEGAPPTKAELKAQRAAVDSLVVDATKLKQIFGIAKKAGPEAEAALVQNIFDRVLKPQRKTVVETPAPEMTTLNVGTFEAPAPEPVHPLASALEKKANGLLLDATEAKAVREAGLEPSQITPLINDALTALREGKLITAEQAKAVRTLGVDVTRGEIKGFDGKVWFQRGKADPAFLGVLTALGIGALAIPHVVDWWNNSGGLSGDNARDVGPGLAAAGAAGVIKGKGGMWHPETVRRMAGDIFPYNASILETYRSIAPDLLEPGEHAAYVKAEMKQGWSEKAVTNYLNRHAGTATDPIKDLRLPDGTKWEDLTDSGFSGTAAREYQATPGMSKIAKEQRAFAAGAKPDELIWEQNVLGTPLGAPPGPGIGVGRSHTIMKNYLSHVGDYIASLNLTPEKLQQMDLPRAIRETVANDKRIAEMALRDVTRPNPTKIADTQALPLWKEYPAESSGPRKFSFNKDGSLQQLASVELPAGEVQYSWREIKLQDSLTPDQARRIRLETIEEWDLRDKQTLRGDEHVPRHYIALDAKGKPIIDNFSQRVASGETLEQAHLAGQLAQEGNSLGHCVGGYVENVLGGYSRIVSLRDQHGRSYATVELQSGKNSVLRPDQEHLRGDSIMQIKGPGNGAPADYVQPYVQDFVKSGKWGAVEDLHHTGLVQVGDAFHDRATLIKRAKAQELEATGRPMSDSDAAYIMDHPKEYSGMLSKLLKQTGKADTDLLIKIAGGAAAAAYLMSDAPKDDKLTLAAMGLAGTLGMKGRFEGVPEPKVLETFRKGGREAEYAAAHIYETTHRQLERSVTQMGKDLPVDDIVQEVYDKAFRSLKLAAEDPRAFRGDSKISTYLHMIAKREAVDYIRYGRSRLQTSSLEVDPETGASAAPEGHMMAQSPEKYTSAYDQAATNQMTQAMQGAMDKLSEERKAAFNAVEMEGMSYQEAAAELGIPENTVRSRVFRAKEDLQGFLRQYNTPGKPGHLQAGKMDNDLLIGAGGGVVAGALIGNVLDPEHKLRDSLYGALAGGVLATGAGRGALKAAIKAPDAALGLISTRLGNIAAELKLALRNHEMRVLKALDAMNDKTLPFLQAMKKLTPEENALVSRALLNGDMAALQRVPGVAATFVAVQKVLGGLETQLQGLGRFSEGVTNYFPRLVKDFEGLKAAMGQEAALGLDKVLVEAEAKMIRKESRGLTELEQSLIVNRYIFGPDQSSFLPGYAKGRKIQEVPEQLAPFYEEPTQSLLRYMSAAANDIETARFFGRDLTSKSKGGKQFTDLDSSIGNLTARLIREGKINGRQAMEVRDILKARFEQGNKGANPIIAAAKNVTNAALLGNFASAATQIGDSVMTVYHQGLVPTLQAVVEKVAGKERLTPKDFGLVNHIAEELADMGGTGRLVHNVLKYSGFQKIDMFAKGLALNASLIKNSKLASTPEGLAKLRAKWEPAFGQDFPALVQELQSGKVGPLTEALSFSELSDMQPVSKAEMPQMYLEHPNGRVLYMLKTYMLKQVDILRRDAYEEIAKGTPEGIMRGTKNLAALATVYAVSNVPGDVVKDWLSGRKSDPLATPRLVENVMQTFGINRYSASQLGQGKVVETATAMMTPPVRVLQDIVQMSPKAVAYVPLVGRPVYDRYFDGNVKREIYEKRLANKGLAKGTGQPLSPAAKKYLAEKRAKAKAAGK